MAVKATHRGHCQVCNRIQKLPDGKMAKHGYKLLGGYFEGTCFGSAELPLEQDTKIVVKSIKWAEQRRIEFEQMIPIWSTPATSPEAWFDEYIVSKNRYIPDGYHWNRVTLVRETVTSPSGYVHDENYYIGYDLKKVPLSRFSIHGDNLLEIATELNKRYVDHHLRKAVKDMTEYIHNQQHRIKVWHKQPLLPLDDREVQS